MYGNNICPDKKLLVGSKAVGTCRKKLNVVGTRKYPYPPKEGHLKFLMGRVGGF